MAERVIPLADHRYLATAPAIPATLPRPPACCSTGCSGRCTTCASRSPTAATSAAATACRRRSSTSSTPSCRTRRCSASRRSPGWPPLFVAHGVRKIRLTGGEPLLRRDLERLVAMLAELRTVEGEPLDLTLTTNGSILARKAESLKHAGLGRVTVSLDALDDAIFRRMNDADFPVAEVLAGIDAAERAGLGPLKVNMVVKRGTNDARDRADGAPFPRPQRGAALHRVHGRRRHQRLAHGRGAALGRGDRADRRGVRARAHAGQHRRRDRRALALCRAGRGRRDRHDLERHQGLLPRLQPGPPLDRRQALPLPVRQPRPRPARPAARRRQRRRDRRGDRPGLAGPGRPLLRAARPRRGRRPAPASAGSRCTTSAAEPAASA